MCKDTKIKTNHSHTLNMRSAARIIRNNMAMNTTCPPSPLSRRIQTKSLIRFFRARALEHISTPTGTDDRTSSNRNASYCMKLKNVRMYNALIVVFIVMCCTIGNVFFMAMRLDGHLVASSSSMNNVDGGYDHAFEPNIGIRSLRGLQSSSEEIDYDDSSRRRARALTQRRSLEENIPQLLNAFISSQRPTETISSSTSSNTNVENNYDYYNHHIQLSNVFQGKNISSDPNSITLVTQGNVSRFPRLLHLLQRWQGPISCAMYITTEEELYNWHNYVQEQRNNTLFQKYVSLHLIFKPSSSSLSDNLYPINLLRNLALQHAKHQSDYVFLDDIDLMPPPQSHTTILSLLQQHDLQPKTFWILPAFERLPADKHDIQNDDITLIPRNKSSLYDALQREDIQPFHAHNPLEHGLTNYAKWYNATTIYDIEYGFKFEPYGIVRSQELHDFYPDFRGFGGNKLTFFIEAYYREFKFQVLPNHFVVHMTHDFQDTRNSITDGNRREVYPKFQRYLEERYGIPTSSSTYEELQKKEYRYRDSMINTTNFPCHYLINREKEFDIIPSYNKLQRVNTLVKWLPSSTQSKYDITIVTMMDPSQSMFKRLEKMANNWSGQISVAVFINSNDDEVKDKAMSKIRQFQSKHEDSFGLRVVFHLVINLRGDRGKDQNIFPRNLLRNVALDNAPTDYVLVLDMDLAPSLNAHDYLKKHLQSIEEKETLLSPSSSTSSSYALVVPAFQRSSKYGEDENLARTKPELLQIMKENPKIYDIFLRKDKLQAHNATNYDKWFNITATTTTSESNNGIYNVSYVADYEPYIVVKKDANLQPFWEHFTGFGRNKLEWIEELYLSGYEFLVVPDCFVVHKNHKKYGLRKIRPFIVDEYSWRFESYVKKKYGRRIQDVKAVSAWGDLAYEKWGKLQEENKTEEVSWERMVENSDNRDKEFATCMDIIKTKHL